MLKRNLHSWSTATFLAGICLSPAFGLVQSPSPSPAAASVTKDDDGFVTQPELQRIVTAIRAKRLPEARRLADALIAKPKPLASSSGARLRQFVRANAYYLRGQINEQDGAPEAATEDYARASDLGQPDAPYLAGAHLLIQARQENPAAANLKARAFKYLQMGAELGDPRCMEVLQGIYKSQGKKEEMNYWFLLQRMSEPLERMQQFKKFYEQQYTSADRAFLASVVKKLSVAGGSAPRVSRELPGRSDLTAAFVDGLMRVRLGFVWRAFFDPTRQTRVTVRQAFSNYRQAFPRNAFASVFLLAEKKRESDGPEVVALGSRTRLADCVLPGDEIIVRSGDRTHQATVWSIDRKTGKVLVLDPFPEFWQPSHNRDIKVFQRKPYRHYRELTALSWAEVKGILTAVIAIRDHRP